MNKNTQSLNLYIHIPYCYAKCPYCGFFSCTQMDNTYEEYFKALGIEIKQKGKHFKRRAVKTIYIGGGTPNLVPSKYIVTLLNDIKNSFNMDQNLEITIELYPQYIDKQKLTDYKSAGVNRLSIGLQATDNKHLKLLTRRYTYEDFLDKLEIAKTLGYLNIGIDLIFGFPQHTLKEWEKSLELVTQLGIQHLSCYSLEVEEGTPYGKLNLNGNLSLPSESVNRDMYHYTCKYLESKGFKQYEISNFSLPNFECKHNLNFWHYEDYLGLGAGAYSRIGDIKSHNVEDIEKYIQGDNYSVVDDITNLSDIKKEEYILGLRLNEGIPYDKRIFDSMYMKKINNRIALNITGKDMYNQVICKILE